MTRPGAINWDGVPEEVKRQIIEKFGSSVVEVDESPHGFRPNFTGILTFGNASRVFVKAARAARGPDAEPALEQHLKDCLNEIEINKSLPATAPAPRFLNHGEVENALGTRWVWLATQAVNGRPPPDSPTAEDLSRYVRLYDRTIESLRDWDLSGAPHIPIFPYSQERNQGAWQRIRADSAVWAKLESNSGWVGDNFTRLVELDRALTGELEGNYVFPGDVGLQNNLFATDPEGDVRVDWSSLAIGPVWPSLVWSIAAAGAKCTPAELEEVLASSTVVGNLEPGRIDAFLAVQSGALYEKAYSATSDPATQEACRQAAKHSLNWLRARLVAPESGAGRRKARRPHRIHPHRPGLPNYEPPTRRGNPGR